MSPEITQHFLKIDTNVYVYKYWTLAIYEKTFELYGDPEIDTRYYYGSLEQLEEIIASIV